GANIVVGHLVSCFGAADRQLGMLATVLGEWELADRHFAAPPPVDPEPRRGRRARPSRRPPEWLSAAAVGRWPVGARARRPAAGRPGDVEPRDRIGAVHQWAHYGEPRAQHPS